jgi:hypothetical protein
VENAAAIGNPDRANLRASVKVRIEQQAGRLNVFRVCGETFKDLYGLSLNHASVS